MDLRDSNFVCLCCLVLFTAYLYHSILVLHDNLGHKSSIIDTLKQIQDAMVREQEQQKFKLDDLRTKVSINTDDNLELQENVLSNHNNIKTLDETFVDLRRNLLSLQNKVDLYGVTITAMQRHELQIDKSIFKMKTENIEQIEDLKETIAMLQSDHNGVKYAHVETKEQLIQTKMLLRNDLLSLKNKIESTEVNIKAIEKDNLQRERTILEMKTENMRDLKEIYTRLQSDHNGVKDELEEIKRHLKDTFGQIIVQFKEVYRVTQRINDRLDDTGIVWIIKRGISMLAQIALNFFLGPIAGHIE